MKKFWKDVLKAGNKLKIRTSFENIGQLEMNTSIIDISPRRNRNYIVIKAPNSSGQLIPLTLGMNIEIFKEEGAGIYQFKGIVLDKLNYEEIKTSYMISVPEYIERADRRSLKRLDINLDINFKTNRPNDMVEKGVTIDISGGGFSFITKNNKLKKGDIITVNILFDDFELKDERCKITRGPTKKPNNIFLYSAMFLEIKPYIQDRIVGFIFRKEIEMSKKDQRG
jgi:c-di-GMP-binding flagellar brake protein YcgR